MKTTSRVPLQSVSELLSEESSLTKIGEVQVSELFTFEIKPVVKEGELLIYYVERE